MMIHLGFPRLNDAAVY